MGRKSAELMGIAIFRERISALSSMTTAKPFRRLLTSMLHIIEKGWLKRKDTGGDCQESTSYLAEL
jgi:hypothetical protein